MHSDRRSTKCKEEVSGSAGVEMSNDTVVSVKAAALIIEDAFLAVDPSADDHRQHTGAMSC